MDQRSTRAAWTRLLEVPATAKRLWRRQALHSHPMSFGLPRTGATRWATLPASWLHCAHPGPGRSPCHLAARDIQAQVDQLRRAQPYRLPLLRKLASLPAAAGWSADCARWCWCPMPSSRSRRRELPEDLAVRQAGPTGNRCVCVAGKRDRKVGPQLLALARRRRPGGRHARAGCRRRAPQRPSARHRCASSG